MHVLTKRNFEKLYILGSHKSGLEYGGPLCSHLKGNRACGVTAALPQPRPPAGAQVSLGGPERWILDLVLIPLLHIHNSKSFFQNFEVKMKRAWPD
jgi:hypothetical protein